jgi:hypothetical protein
MPTAANDNKFQFASSLDLAVAGQAITITQTHRRFGRSYAEFVRHAGDGKHIYVRKLISGMWKGRWTKPLKIERSLVIGVHTSLARPEMQGAA